MNEIIRVIGELLFIDNVGAFIRFIRYNIFERRKVSYSQLLGTKKPQTKDQKEITKRNDENFLYGFVFLFIIVSSIGIYHAYSGDTRSAIPVIPVHSVVDLQYRRQN